MSDDIPLRVLVAEALGCKTRASADEWFCGCKEASHRFDGGAGRIAEYDTEWRDGGPLIERFRIALHPITDRRYAQQRNRWQARGGHREAVGLTPLQAVCLLVVALANAQLLKL